MNTKNFTMITTTLIIAGALGGMKVSACQHEPCTETVDPKTAVYTTNQTPPAPIPPTPIVVRSIETSNIVDLLHEAFLTEDNAKNIASIQTDLVNLLVEGWTDKSENSLSSEFVESIEHFSKTLEKALQNENVQILIEDLVDIPEDVRPAFIKTVFNVKALEKLESITAWTRLEGENFSSYNSSTWNVKSECPDGYIQRFKHVAPELQNLVLASWLVDQWDFETKNSEFEGCTMGCTLDPDFFELENLLFGDHTEDTSNGFGAFNTFDNDNITLILL